MQVRVVGAPLVLGAALCTLAAARWLPLAAWTAAAVAVALMALVSLRLPTPTARPVVVGCARCVGALAQCVSTLGFAICTILLVLGIGTNSSGPGFTLLTLPLLLIVAAIHIAGRRLARTTANIVVIVPEALDETVSAPPTGAHLHPAHP